MWKQWFYTLAFILLNCPLHSQGLEKKLQQWDEQQPIQKLYLHLDRETYFAGQTIWLKAYFLSHYVPASKNSTLYVELLNHQSQIVLRQIFPCLEGQAIGQLDLPHELASGSYQLRAYAPRMRHQPDFLFTKRIEVIGPEPPLKGRESQPKPRLLEKDAVQIRFFPEGGNLLTGKEQQVAFQVTDAGGYPRNTRAELRNSSGHLIATLQTLHDGMGVFALRSMPGESYYVTLPGLDQQFDLPAASGEGVLFSIAPRGPNNRFVIRQVGQNPNFEPAFLIGQMQHQVVFSQSFGGPQKSITGVLQTKDLLSGILQVTVFNKEGLPLAERLTFVDNKEYLLPAALTIDSTKEGRQGAQAYSLKVLDSLTCSFSLSVTNADYEPVHRPNNIISHFLLTSDLKGYVHDPAWYFLSDADSVKQALDLVLMTHGWSRFKWSELAAGKGEKAVDEDPGYISLKGIIQLKGSSKPLANSEVALLLIAADTSVKKRDPLRILHTDAKGRFELDSLVFFGATSLFVSDVQAQNRKGIQVRLEDSLWAPVVLPPLNLPLYRGHIVDHNKGEYRDAYQLWQKVSGEMLQPVTLHASRKTPKEEVEARYVTNPLFQGNIDAQSLDLVNEKAYGTDLFAYINNRLPGWRSGRYKFYDPPQFYLNDVEIDYKAIKEIPLYLVAYVKVVGGYMGTGTSALAVYLKQGADLVADAETGVDVLQYRGYSIIKEFYDATREAKACETFKPANQFTLQWKPDIFLSAKNPVLPIKFCSNSFSPNIKVVVEGVTDDGRFLMFEKIIRKDGK